MSIEDSIKEEQIELVDYAPRKERNMYTGLKIGGAILALGVVGTLYFSQGRSNFARCVRNFVRYRYYTSEIHYQGTSDIPFSIKNYFR